MTDRLADLETRLESLRKELAVVRDRLDRLEAEDRAPRTETLPDVIAEVEAPQTAVVAGAVGLVGRTLMALGGAYLLRP